MATVNPYDYFMYLKDDTSNERLNLARKDFGYEGQDMYVITKDGEIHLVQSDKIRPNTKVPLEEAAKLHVQECYNNDLEAEKKAADTKAQEDRIAALEAQIAALTAAQAANSGV